MSLRSETSVAIGQEIVPLLDLIREKQACAFKISSSGHFKFLLKFHLLVILFFAIFIQARPRDRLAVSEQKPLRVGSAGHRVPFPGPGRLPRQHLSLPPPGATLGQGLGDVRFAPSWSPCVSAKGRRDARCRGVHCTALASLTSKEAEGAALSVEACPHGAGHQQGCRPSAPGSTRGWSSVRMPATGHEKTSGEARMRTTPLEK